MTQETNNELQDEVGEKVLRKKKTKGRPTPATQSPSTNSKTDFVEDEKPATLSEDVSNDTDQKQVEPKTENKKSKRKKPKQEVSEMPPMTPIISESQDEWRYGSYPRPDFEMSWQVPFSRSAVDFDGPYVYERINCTINMYYGEDLSAIKHTANSLVQMLIAVMDAVRMHIRQVDMNGVTDYSEILSDETKSRLEAYLDYVMPKPEGPPRITVECKYGFTIGDLGQSAKITIHEYSNPIDTFVVMMNMLEPMFRLSARVYQQEKIYQDSLNKTERKSKGKTKDRNTIDGNGIIKVESTKLPERYEGEYDCISDDAAQRAPYDSLVRYHAVRYQYSAYNEGRWTFYALTESQIEAGLTDIEKVDKGSVMGMYFYQNQNKEFWNECVDKGALPIRQDKSSGKCRLIIDAVKRERRSGDGAVWEVVRIQREASS